MNQDEMLKIFGDTGALLQGHFELRSKLHSDRYFQCAHVLRYPRLAGTLCAALVEKLLAGQPGAAGVDGVMSPALGGILVGPEVARLLNVRSIFAEKQNDKLVLRRFAIQPGESYIVAEDVITRGGRVQETIDIVEQGGGKVEAVAVLVDRSGGAARFAYPTFSLLRMDVVTYEPSECPLCRRGLPLTHPGS